MRALHCLLLLTAGAMMAMGQQTQPSRQLVVSAARFTGNHLDQDVSWGSPRDSGGWGMGLFGRRRLPLTATAFPLTAAARRSWCAVLPCPAVLFGFAAEISLLCYSPWYGRDQWRLFAHLPIVDTAGIW